MGWIPPPWVVLALVFTFASNVGDVHQLLVLSLRAAVGGKDSGCELCHHTTAFILKVSELDEADAVDCNNLCFGTRKCSEVCSKIMTALATSKQYPCVAAGLCPVEDVDSDIVCRFDWRSMRCTPSTACARKFPARCVIRDGLQTWRRQINMLGKHAGLMANALANQPRCGDEGAGPYCVQAPSWFGSHAAELLSWALPFCVGTLASVRAVETPGGDDDRQWLTFWICFFLFSLLERFTSVVLSSWLPLYYEVKLLILCWLMFFHGADGCYRAARRALSRTRRAMPPPPELLAGVSRVCQVTLNAALGDGPGFERQRYFRALPVELRADWSLGEGPRRLRSAALFDRYVQSKLGSERAVVRHFGSRPLAALRVLWDQMGAPRYLQVPRPSP